MIPAVLLERGAWSVSNFVDYDNSVFLIALAQFSHRLIAYILTFSGLYIFFGLNRGIKMPRKKWISMVFITLLVIQVVLGITVLLNSIGTLPVLYGVLHQGFAILLLTSTIMMYYFNTHEGDSQRRTDTSYIE
jgi:heme A synthase